MTDVSMIKYELEKSDTHKNFKKEEGKNDDINETEMVKPESRLINDRLPGP